MNPAPFLPPVPVVKDIEQRLIQMRSRLQEIFDGLHTIHTVIVVSAESMSVKGAYFDSEVAHVLRRCAGEKVHDLLTSLTSIIELLGGRTEYTEDCGRTAEVHGGQVS